MSENAERARRQPGPLAEISGNETRRDPFGDRPLCGSRGCLSPAVVRLGAPAYCYDHAYLVYRDLRAAEVRRRRLDPAEIGLGLFHRPAPGWPVPYVYVECDVCGAGWVDKYARFPLCPWCLDRAEARRA